MRVYSMSFPWRTGAQSRHGTGPRDQCVSLASRSRTGLACPAPCASARRCGVLGGSWRAMRAPHQVPRGGGGVCVGENMNLQILARQNLCHFLKMSEQIMYGSQ